MDRLDNSDAGHRVPFKSEVIPAADFEPRRWPTQPGNYSVVAPEKSIALVLFNDGALDVIQKQVRATGIAIVGTISTENLGVEHLVKNVISNPYIRYVVLWGRDIEGHFPGDALQCLADGGCDDSGRICGARGARPVLKNLTTVEIDHFRNQVQVIDMTGADEVPELVGRLERLDNTPVQPYKFGLKVDLVATLRAVPARRLKLDPSGYFVIMVIKGAAHPLVIEHYSNDGRLRDIIEGKDAATLCSTVIERGLISQLDHAAYLGRELAKAEISLGSNVKYLQDRAQGDMQ